MSDVQDVVQHFKADDKLQLQRRNRARTRRFSRNQKLWQVDKGFGKWLHKSLLSLTYMLSHVIHHGNDWNQYGAQVKPAACPFKGVQGDGDLACLKVM